MTKFLEIKPRWNPITDHVEARVVKDKKDKDKVSVQTTSIPRRKPKGY